MCIADTNDFLAWAPTWATVKWDMECMKLLKKGYLLDFK